MRRVLSLSIRAQMLLLALVMALPAAGIIIHSGYTLRQQVVSEAVDEIRKLCDGMANEQLEAAQSAEVLMAALAQLPEIQNRHPEKTQQILADILSRNDLFLNISVIDSSGTVWASALNTQPVTAADRRHFRNAMATGRLSSGEYVLCRIRKKPTIILCYPFRDAGGSVAGAMAIALRLDRLGQNIHRSYPEKYSYTIGDRNGVVLAGSPQPGKVTGGSELPEIIENLQSGGIEGTFTGRGFGGYERFIAFRKLYLKGESEPYLYVRSAVPVSLVLAQANKLLIQNLVIFASSLVCALLAAWFIGKRLIVDRVSALRSASRRLAEGDLKTRVGDLLQGGELGELAAAFDDMARKLESRESERDEAEHALRSSWDELKASQEQTRLFFERQVVGMAITSPDKGWLQSNARLRQMLGYSEDELHKLCWATLTHPEDLEQDLTHFHLVLAGKIDEYFIEKRYIRKDRTLLHAQIAVSCVRKNDGSVCYLLAVVNDITERKRAEEELRQLHAHLEQRVQERTAQLEDAIKEQESFSYSVSHDLRSPLRHINSYLSIIREEFGACFPVEALHLMERAGAASVKMGKLIDDLLELSRVSRSALVKEPVDLTSLAESIMTRLRETEPGRAADVAIEPGLVVMGDKVLMGLVLENLLGNAWKYTSRNEKTSVRFGARKRGAETTFYVEDNGAGFDMAFMDKLFRPFQRLHGEEYHGTGIGLATVKRIMERHGGEIAAESRVGAGATFYFSLPCS